MLGGQGRRFLAEAGESIGQREQAGWRFLQAGNPRAAVREFKSALAVNPESFGALTGLAQGHLNLGEFGHARDVAETLLRLAPDQPVSHRLMSSAERQRFNREKALQYANEALKLDPHDPLSYHAKGNVLFDMRRLQEALDVVRKGRETAPYFAALAAQEAMIVLQRSGGKAAEPIVLEAMRMAPDDEYVLGVAARVKLARGDLGEARALTTRILQHNANNEEAISIYLLSDPGKYGLLRAHTRFPNWRREHGVLGRAVEIGLWTVLIVVSVVLIMVSHVPGIVLALAYRWFWMSQYNGHRKEVKAHFTQPQLKPGF
jgi:tetratricopeptide (TPR) repeat protein